MHFLPTRRAIPGPAPLYRYLEAYLRSSGCRSTCKTELRRRAWSSADWFRLCGWWRGKLVRASHSTSNTSNGLSLDRSPGARKPALSVFAHAPGCMCTWTYTGPVRALLATSPAPPRSSPPSSAPSRGKSAAPRSHRSGLRSVAQEFDWEFDLIRQAPSFPKNQNRDVEGVTFGPNTPKRAGLGR